MLNKINCKASLEKKTFYAYFPREEKKLWAEKRRWSRFFGADKEGKERRGATIKILFFPWKKEK